MSGFESCVDNCWEESCKSFWLAGKVFPCLYQVLEIQPIFTLTSGTNNVLDDMQDAMPMGVPYPSILPLKEVDQLMRRCQIVTFVWTLMDHLLLSNI